MVVVEDQHDVDRDGAEIIEHRCKNRFDRRRLRRPQKRDRAGTGRGYGGLQCADQVGPEGCGIVVSLVEREPCHGAFLSRSRCQPLGQERRLPKAGRCGDERQFRFDASVQDCSQSWAWHQTASPPGDEELGREQRGYHTWSRIAPTVKPWIKLRCRAANTTNGGTIAIASPANSKAWSVA